ncbi:MAG: START domain-containing protein [Bacteroidota bacterium]
MNSQRFLWSFILLFFTLASTAQDAYEWKFKKEKSGIKVYTRDVSDTNLKELKITLEVQASMSSIVALLMDVDEYQNWVYRCAKSKTVKVIDQNHTYDYYVVDFPWPMADRDLMAYSYIEQDPETKVLTSITKARPDYTPKNDGYVRIIQHINKWVFTPLAPNRVAVEYTLNSSPAGSIPNWLVNMAIDQGPVQSMLRFRDMLNNQPYKDAKLAGILEF